MTYSIVALDRESGDLGVAVQTHAAAVGSLCPFAKHGVGAVATQAFVNVSYGPDGLRAMRAGEAPADALARLLAADDGANVRQVAFVDAAGAVAAHTGERCIAFASHVAGDGFSCQANMMRDAGVPAAMADAFTTTSGPLHDRLLAALDAGEAAGGDIRGTQSAALIVARADGRLDLRVDDAADPHAELRRLVRITTDWPDGLAAHGRGNPEGWFWTGIQAASDGDLDRARELVQRAYAEHDGWRELARRLPAAGLLDQALADELTGPGTPG